MNILSVQGITKHYPSFTLRDITFSLPQGRIMGLIGKNGAGKTTTLSLWHGVPVRMPCAISYFYVWSRNKRYLLYRSAASEKKGYSKAKCLLMVLAQMTQLLISLPFAVLRVHVLPNGNPAGIEANVAYYGFGLMIYAIFNVILLTQFFKTAYKVGIAFLLAIIPAAIAVVIIEVLVHFPGFEWLDSVVPNIMFRQFPILAIGVIVYIIGMLIAYRVSAKRFEQVDL